LLFLGKAGKSGREEHTAAKAGSVAQFVVENDEVRRFATPPTRTACKHQLRNAGCSAAM
jgi:hypothetical protein